MDTSHVHLSVTRPPCVGSYQIKFSSFRGWLICNLGRAQCARYSLEFLNIDIVTTPIQTIFRESAYKYIPLIESAYLGFHNLWMGVWTHCLHLKIRCLSTAGGIQCAITEYIVLIRVLKLRNASHCSRYIGGGCIFIWGQTPGNWSHSKGKTKIANTHAHGTGLRPTVLMIYWAY